MADPKWTPGPWEVTELRNGDIRQVAVKQTGVRWGDGGIAVVVSDHRHHDAHLIAAAPDLYEALRCLVEAFEQIVPLNPDHVAYDAYKRAIDELRKARGEE